MTLHIYTLAKTLFDGQIDSVSLPTTDGIITVLPHHANLVVAIKEGVILAKIDNKETAFKIKSGFAKISEDSLIVLAEENKL